MVDRLKDMVIYKINIFFRKNQLRLFVVGQIFGFSERAHSGFSKKYEFVVIIE